MCVRGEGRGAAWHNKHHRPTRAVALQAQIECLIVTADLDRRLYILMAQDDMMRFRLQSTRRCDFPAQVCVSLCTALSIGGCISVFRDDTMTQRSHAPHFKRNMLSTANRQQQKKRRLDTLSNEIDIERETRKYMKPLAHRCAGI